MILALVLLGCIDGPQSSPFAMNADFDVFVDDVQPILSSRCSNPACHGAEGRPLEIYAVQQHRLDPKLAWSTEPLTDQELLLNFYRACGFMVDLEYADECDLLLKPLNAGAGGSEHVGGSQFNETSNPEYELIRAWIAQGLLP
jgi:hypothetical protein